MHTTLLPSLDHLHQPAVRWRIKNDFLTILGGFVVRGFLGFLCGRDFWFDEQIRHLSIPGGLGAVQ